MKKKRIIHIFLFLILPIILSVGFSSWIITATKDRNMGTTPTQAVCYIKENGESTKYTRIEKALEVANANAANGVTQTVVVIPGLKDVTDADNKKIYQIRIEKSCSINSGVTLKLPYDSSGTITNEDNFGDGSSNVFADRNAESVLTNRKTLVTISEGVTLTVNTGGTLLIGGMFGSGAQSMAGGVNGSYCEINLEKNAVINSYGTIESYGYIKEADYSNNGSMLILNKGVLKIPFVIYDYKGGTITSETEALNICPFSIYDMCNIQTKMRIYSTAQVKAQARISVSIVGEVAEWVTVVGNSTDNTALILSSGYTDIKYTPNDYRYTTTTVGDGITKAYLHGVLDMGSLQISMKKLGMGIDINTNDYDFPVSYKFQYYIESGSTLNIDKRVKFMPGSRLEIKKDANLNISNSVIFYDSTFYSDEYYTYSSNANFKTFRYPLNTDGTVMDDAVFVNNGITTVMSGGALAGFIDSTDKDAVLSFNIDVYDVECTEGMANSDTKWTYNVSNTSKGILQGTSFTSPFLQKGVYVSKENIEDNKKIYKWSSFTASFNISYKKMYTDSNNNILSDMTCDYTNHGMQTTLNIQNNYSLNSSISSEEKGENIYTFVGWYFDSELVNKVADNVVYGAQLLGYADGDNNVTLYAKFTAAPIIKVKYFGGVSNNVYVADKITEEEYIPGDKITLKAGFDYYLVENNDSGKPNKKTTYSFTTWTLTCGDITEILSPGESFTIPDDATEETIIEIRPTTFDSSYLYALVINDASSCISSYEGYSSSDYDSTNNCYWIENGTPISITITGSFAYYKYCTITTGATFNEGTQLKTSWYGGTATGTFTMPTNYVLVTTSDNPFFTQKMVEFTYFM